MLIMEMRALITDLQDKMIALLVEKQEVLADGNTVAATGLQCRIDRLKAECADIRNGAEDPPCSRRYGAN